MAILVFMDEVLRNHKKHPIVEGISFYKTLKEKHRVLILCEDKDKADHWLRQQRINNYDDLVALEDVPFPGDNPKLRHVEWVRSQGPVEYVLTSDPDLAVKLLVRGITTIMFLHPVYTNENFRPDGLKRGFKPWAEIQAELIRQQDEYDQDERRDRI